MQHNVPEFSQGTNSSSVVGAATNQSHGSCSADKHLRQPVVNACRHDAAGTIDAPAAAAGGVDVGVLCDAAQGSVLQQAQHKDCACGAAHSVAAVVDAGGLTGAAGATAVPVL